jgi:hypothetical protein
MRTHFLVPYVLCARAHLENMSYAGRGEHGNLSASVRNSFRNYQCCNITFAAKHAFQRRTATKLENPRCPTNHHPRRGCLTVSRASSPPHVATERAARPAGRSTPCEPKPVPAPRAPASQASRPSCTQALGASRKEENDAGNQTAKQRYPHPLTGPS